ncbi:MAG: hypothetical protein AAGA40_18110 [Cyanobacteria bacterium P01_E01_bin.45]
MNAKTIPSKHSLSMGFAALTTAILLLTASPASATGGFKADSPSRDNRIEATVEARESLETLESESESHQKRFFGRKFGHRRHGHRHHRHHRYHH